MRRAAKSKWKTRTPEQRKRRNERDRARYHEKKEQEARALLRATTTATSGVITAPTPVETPAVIAMRLVLGLHHLNFCNIKCFKQQVSLSFNTSGAVPVFARIKGDCGKTTALQSIYLFIRSFNACREGSALKQRSDLDARFITQYLNAKDVEVLLPKRSLSSEIRLQGNIHAKELLFGVIPTAGSLQIRCYATNVDLKDVPDYYVTYFHQLMGPIPEQKEEFRDVNSEIVEKIEEGRSMEVIRNVIAQILVSPLGNEFKELVAGLLSINLIDDIDVKSAVRTVDVFFTKINATEMILPLNLLSGSQHLVLVVLASCFYIRKIHYPEKYHIFLLDEPTKNLPDDLTIRFINALTEMNNCQVITATNYKVDPCSIANITMPLSVSSRS